MLNGVNVVIDRDIGQELSMHLRHFVMDIASGKGYTVLVMS